MTNGMVELDSAFGKEIGFTSDKFSPASYLWLDEGVITISMIESLHPGKGNFREMIDQIRKKGYAVEVPAPFPRMRKILEKLGCSQRFDKFYCDTMEILRLE